MNNAMNFIATKAARAILLALAAFVSQAASAAPCLDFLFKDSFVFSAANETSLKGFAKPLSPVTVKLLGREFRTAAGADGRFEVKIPSLGVVKTPFEMTVADPTGVAAVRDCLSGIVILAGGQSNMEVPVKEALNPVEEAAAADYPLIREFKVKHDFNFTPQKTLKGRWTVVTPKSAPGIGAVGYYTARMLHRELGGVPVGIINNSVSASPIESWLPEEYLRSDKKFNRYFVRKFEEYRALGRDGVIKLREELGNTLFHVDGGNAGLAKGWHKGAGADWKDIKIPNTLETVWTESADGAFWFAREVDVPAEYAGRDIEFRALALDDHDITYFNGVEVGRTGEETPDAWNVPRAYKIPGRLVKAGKNVISIRIFDSAHAGGIFSEKTFLALPGGAEINLAGMWKTAAEKILLPKKWPPDYLPLVKINRNGATLYNAMFAPLKGVKVDAVLWYQGESNAGQKLYAEMFKKLITTWREHLESPKAPFVFVQLAAFRARPKNAADTGASGNWPLTRALQAEALELPDTRMVPAIDIGDAFRIHPLNKQEVGRRCALWLLQDYFAKDRFKGAISFPEAVAAKVENGRIVITLKNAEGLKTTDGKPPKSFSVAGVASAKTRYRTPAEWAEAEIKDGTIVVTIPEKMPDPVAVRYAWHMNPEINTVDAKGRPLLPFELKLK